MANKQKQPWNLFAHHEVEGHGTHRLEHPDEYWKKKEEKKNKLMIAEDPPLEEEKPKKRWLAYEDGTHEPAPSQAEINNKPRGNGEPDFWVVEKDADWMPSGRKRTQKREQKPASLFGPTQKERTAEQAEAKPESGSLFGGPKKKDAPLLAPRKPDPHLRPWTGKRGGADRTPEPPVRAPEELIGSPEYYRFRADDFKRRNPGKEPPPYLMDFGHKYAERFTKELRPKLSEQGKQWLDKTRELLQRKMEDGLAAGEMDEHDHEAFKAKAFDMHSDAYLEGGIRKLPFFDLTEIIAEPDLTEWLKGGTIQEALETTAPMVGIPAASLLGLDRMSEEEKAQWIKTLKDGPSQKPIWDWSDDETRQWIDRLKRH